MDDRDGERRSGVVSQDWLAQAPKVSDALKKGMIVSISTWTSLEITGIVCDRDLAGLLLDVREPEAEAEGYSFLPWSSIEQVKIREVTQRRVKFLQG
jgi:hypothetical protein